jgi:hypothetical protein
MHSPRQPQGVKLCTPPTWKQCQQSLTTAGSMQERHGLPSDLLKNIVVILASQGGNFMARKIGQIIARAIAGASSGFERLGISCACRQENCRIDRARAVTVHQPGRSRGRRLAALHTKIIQLRYRALTRFITRGRCLLTDRQLRRFLQPDQVEKIIATADPKAPLGGSAATENRVVAHRNAPFAGRATPLWFAEKDPNAGGLISGYMASPRNCFSRLTALSFFGFSCRDFS